MNIVGQRFQVKGRAFPQRREALDQLKAKRAKRRSPSSSSRGSADGLRLSAKISHLLSPLKNLAKTTLMTAGVAAGLATLGCVGGLPVIATAAVGGAFLGGSIRPARFPLRNAAGTALSFATAAAIGATGPTGIAVAGVLGAYANIMTSLATNQQEFG